MSVRPSVTTTKTVKNNFLDTMETVPILYNFCGTWARNQPYSTFTQSPKNNGLKSVLNCI